MCGRFASFLPPEAIARLFRAVNRLPNVTANWNVAPTQDAMVVRHHPETGQRHLDLLRWGLLPHFTQDPTRARRPINARAETVATSDMFSSAFVIITTNANTVMTDIHDRMPVIIEHSDWPIWLAEAEGNLPALLRPATDEVLRTWPISKQVNAPRNNGPGLLEPIL